MFQTVEEESKYELTEKKSNFIASLMYVQNKEMAENKIREFKKKFHDARHNCSAYRVIEDDIVYEKVNDDGEPSGTAGLPMLNILQKKNLCNVIIIVTRYFGGILLGTGGLVRCYSDATIGAVENAKKILMKEGIEFEVEIGYNYIDHFKYYCRTQNIKIIDAIYSDKIIFNVEADDSTYKIFIEDVKNKKIEVINIKEIGKRYIKI